MNPDERSAIEGRSILLFDGLCGMCNGIVRFLMRRDPSKRLLYAPLESRLGKEMLATAGLFQTVENEPPGREPAQRRLDSVVLIEAALTPIQRVSIRSDAAVRTLLLLRGAWPLAGHMLAALPRGLRERMYRVVARWRYKVFGAYTSCPMPSDEERRLLLGTDT